MVTFAFLATSVLYDVDGWKDRLKLSLIMALYASTLQFLVGICHQAKFLQVILPALFSFFTLRSLDNRCAACAVIIVGYLGFFAPGGFMPSIDRAIGIFVGVIAIMLATALVGLVHLRHAYISTFGKPFTLIEAWRITLMLGFGTFISNVLKLSQARLCPPVVEQVAAAAALTAPDEYVENVRAEYERRRNLLISLMQRIPGVRCSLPKGAFYFVADLPVDDAEKFALFMLRDFSYNGNTVMFAPAEDFYVTKGMGRRQARFAYVLNEDELVMAAKCLEEGLKAYRSQVMGIRD